MDKSQAVESDPFAIFPSHVGRGFRTAQMYEDRWRRESRRTLLYIIAWALSGLPVAVFVPPISDPLWIVSGLAWLWFGMRALYSQRVANRWRHFRNEFDSAAWEDARQFMVLSLLLRKL